MDKVNRIAGVKEVGTHLDNNQARSVARCMKYSTKLGDIMPVRFGDEGGRVNDDELAEEGEERRWNDHGPEWVGKEGKKDGFVPRGHCIVLYCICSPC